MIDSLCQGRKGGEGDGGEGVDASSALTAAAAGMRRQRLTFALESTRPGEGGGAGGGWGRGVWRRDPPTGRVPATRGGTRRRDRCANERNPAQAQNFSKPAPTNKKKRLALWFMYSDLQWRQSGTSPHAGQSGVGVGAGVGGVGGVMSATRRRRQVKVKSGSSLVSRGRGRATRRSWSSPTPPSSSASGYWRTSLAIRLSSPD